MMSDDIKTRLRYGVSCHVSGVTGDLAADMTVAADHIEQLERELAEARDEEICSAAVCDKLSLILAGVAVALKGDELPLHRHSYHDLVQVAQTKMLTIDLLDYQVGEIKGQLAEARKDALRFAFVESNANDFKIDKFITWYNAAGEYDGIEREYFEVSTGNGVHKGQTVRAAIDAAMKDKP